MWKSVVVFSRLLERAPQQTIVQQTIVSLARPLSTWVIPRAATDTALPFGRFFPFQQFSSSLASSLLSPSSTTLTSVRFLSPRLPGSHTSRGTGFIHCDFATGKKKPEEHVLKRFFRLDWGGWIKRICGRSKRVWKMQRRVRRRRENHVFVSGGYSLKFDKMVTAEYREPKYYVDDIYEPYQHRTGQTWYRSAEQIRSEAMTFPLIDEGLLARRREAAISAARAAGHIAST